MKRKTPDAPPVNGRIAALNRIISITRLIRRNGTPDEADEAVEWERQLQKRIEEIEKTEVAKAA